MTEQERTTAPINLPSEDVMIAMREAMLPHLNDCAALDFAVEAACERLVALGYAIGPSCPAISEDVREEVAKIACEVAKAHSVGISGPMPGVWTSMVEEIASKSAFDVLSYLTSIGWGPTVGREPWGWACWFGDTNTLRDPNILQNYSENNAREALRRIEHPEWHVVTLYERPS